MTKITQTDTYIVVFADDFYNTSTPGKSSVYVETKTPMRGDDGRARIYTTRAEAEAAEDIAYAHRRKHSESYNETFRSSQRVEIMAVADADPDLLAGGSVSKKIVPRRV